MATGEIIPLGRWSVNAENSDLDRGTAFGFVAFWVYKPLYEAAQKEALASSRRMGYNGGKRKGA